MMNPGKASNMDMVEPPHDDGMIPIKELAEYLHVSVPTVRYWVYRGLMPPHCFVKIGQTYRFDKEAVKAAFRVRPPPQPPPEKEQPQQDAQHTATVTLDDFYTDTGEDHDIN